MLDIERTYWPRFEGGRRKLSDDVAVAKERDDIERKMGNGSCLVKRRTKPWRASPPLLIKTRKGVIPMPPP